MLLPPINAPTPHLLAFPCEANSRLIIGVPKEVKDHESRVGITPAGVKALVDASHTVLVETHAGDLSAFSDDEYQSAGAEIVGCGLQRLGTRRHDRQSQRTGREASINSFAKAWCSSLTFTWRPCPR